MRICVRKGLPKLRNYGYKYGYNQILFVYLYCIDIYNLF